MKARMILYADEGKILTDGENYGSQIFLEDGKTEDQFYEITIKEYNEIIAKELERNNIEETPQA